MIADHIINSQVRPSLYGLLVVSVSAISVVRFLSSPPPPPTQFEMRVVIWEAKDVATKDGNQSDVFITIQPRGEDDYEKQSTDTHYYSPGDAEFNWRMTWPVFLPEKAPRLFMQVWDYDLIGADDAIGEAELNLKALYDKVRLVNSR